MYTPIRHRPSSPIDEMLRVDLNGRDYGEEVLTDPLAIQLPVILFRTRKWMFEGVHVVGIAPIKPEN